MLVITLVDSMLFDNELRFNRIFKCILEYMVHQNEIWIAGFKVNEYFRTVFSAYPMGHSGIK